MLNKVEAPGLLNKGWDDERQSYVIRSVSIDPLTGAAEPNKLYAFDVVPPGAKFEVNITGQNLNVIELGFVLFGLYGFNSEIFPLTIGAMSGRGFGRMKFTVTEMYHLNRQKIKRWAEEALEHDHAGYGSLPKLGEDEAKEALHKFKRAFQKVLPGENA